VIGFTPDGNLLCSALVPACGNGILDPGEQCEDGNAVSGDGCSATCHLESEEADVIVAIDTGGATLRIETTLNQAVARLDVAGISARIILIGDPICIPAPLGAGTGCPDENLPGYRHVTEAVPSMRVLETLLDPYAEYQSSLRPTAKKHFVVITDDNDRLSDTEFMSRVRLLTDPGFSPGFKFHSIVYLGVPDGNCSGSATGSTYVAISKATGGATISICELRSQPEAALATLAHAIIGS
jgi:cysteine-rich repeat protein